MEMIIHPKVQYQIKMLMVIVQTLYSSTLIWASLSELNTSRRNGTSVMFAKIYVKIWINGTSVMHLQKVYVYNLGDNLQMLLDGIHVFI